MFSYLNIARTYVFLWVLYGLQGTLYPVGTLCSQIILAFLLLVSIYYCIAANTRYSLPLYIIGLNVLLLLFSVYGVYLMIGGYNSADYAKSIGSFEYLKQIFISLLPIYTFYVFFKEKYITEKEFSFWIVVFLFLATANFYENYRTNLLAAMLVGSRAEEFTNNVGYEFLAVIPLCALLYKKPVVQYVSLGYCVIFLLLSMKRGAILIGAICLIWFMWNNFKFAKMKVKISLIMLSLLLCFSANYIVQKQMSESVYFQNRVEKTLEGNSSGRESLYGDFLNYFWNETTPLQFLFGSGANATIKISKEFAHNDWLEIAINQGLFGLIIYALYWLFFARTVFSRKMIPMLV